jgi:hypothetical protein
MTHEINIADFAAFCRSKAGESYPWCSTHDCALGQYARDRFPHAGSAQANAFGTGITVNGRNIPLSGLPIAFVYDCRIFPGETCEFSVLADRLEALMETADA